VSSPFEALFSKIPDFSSFRVFGIKCFPYLHDYVSNKIGPKSMPYVFIGYSSKCKGYCCLHPLTGHIYTSRNVVFDEHIFPFATPHLLHTSLKNHLMTSFKEWFDTFALMAYNFNPLVHFIYILI
jgi:hypothetical protein